MKVNLFSRECSFGSFTSVYVFDPPFMSIFLFWFYFASDPVFSSFPSLLPCSDTYSWPFSFISSILLVFVLFHRLQDLWEMWKLDSNSIWNGWMKSFRPGPTSSKLCASCSWWSATSSASWLLCRTSAKPMLTWLLLPTKQPSLSITGSGAVITPPGWLLLLYFTCVCLK